MHGYFPLGNTILSVPKVVLLILGLVYHQHTSAADITSSTEDSNGSYTGTGENNRSSTMLGAGEYGSSSTFDTSHMRHQPLETLKKFMSTTPKFKNTHHGLRNSRLAC